MTNAKAYREAWEKQPIFKGWITKNHADSIASGKGEARCKYCNVPLRAHATDLKKHAKTSSHIRQAESRNRKQQPSLMNHVNPSVKRELKIAEIKMALYVANHSSIKSVDHLGEVLKQLGKGSQLEKVRLHRTKASKLILNVVAPEMLIELIKDIGDQDYSVILDESTDVSTVKYMAYCVRYFSNTCNQFVTDFLGFDEVSSATADNLYKNFREFFSKVGLNLDKLDGKKPPKLVQLSDTRWLAWTNAVTVVLKQWDSLKAFFTKLESSPANKDITARNLGQMYRDESNILYLLFLDTVLKEVTDLNIAFQKANADITKLYTDLRILLLSVARRIFKPIYLKSIPSKTASTAMIHQADIAAVQRAISKANCDFDNSLLPLDSVDFGYKFSMYLTKSTISSENLQTVKVRSRSFMLKLCEELVKRFPDNISVLTNIRYFIPKLCMDQTSNVSVECLPWDLAAQDADRDAIERQWRNLRTMRISEICDNVDENISTIDFWIAVNKIENANDSKQFKDLAAFALRALSLPTSNADVERVFSVMAVIKTKCRNRMLIDMLVSLMRIRIHMRVFKLCCKNYMPTDDMVKRFTSQMYVVSGLIG
ncbi:hypothetical protein KQX54_006348 [Cotesia glomerata]|uniref:HAT C-terminal dimerisation domain-containing protein n=1 Tax=Cotesia glomerata TaxID=32391 RepID=A0AAV7IPT3_COTGL|nr:hypothetical protein KQX54_006348 [Cotesia glomerata]